MDAKAIFKAKQQRRRVTAAQAFSSLPARYPGAAESNPTVHGAAAFSAATSVDHNCLREGLEGKLGRTLAENASHVRLHDAEDIMRRAEEIGMAQSEAEFAERAIDCTLRSTGRSAANRKYVRAVGVRHGAAPRQVGRKKRTAMRVSEFVRASAFSALVAAALFGAVGQAFAFDDKVFDDKTGVKPQSNPWAVFQFGFSAYKNGHKDQAVEAYRYAAENGQIGATWKLARMYAEGDGVTRNDYEAFKFFSEIAEQDVEPGSPEESYVSDALVALGGYLKAGIPGSPVSPNSIAAQEYYMRAAANYRNPDAQYEMGKMFLKGDGGVKASVTQAGRWLQLAAEKGHAGAQATLGNLLFQSGKVVRGLAMMTAALERATPSDQPWIRGMQEEAFALADESDRRTAISLAQDILTKGNE